MPTSVFAEVCAENDQLAAAVRSALGGSNLLATNVVGVARGGKTALIEQTLQRCAILRDRLKCIEKRRAYAARRSMQDVPHLKWYFG